jgi:hypothetical protein
MFTCIDSDGWPDHTGAGGLHRCGVLPLDVIIGTLYEVSLGRFNDLPLLRGTVLARNRPKCGSANG